MSNELVTCPACGIYRADYLEWGEENFTCPNCKVRHGRDKIKKFSGSDGVRPTKSSRYRWENGRVKLLFGDHKDKFLDTVDSDYLGWMVKTYAAGGSSFPEDLIVEAEEELKVRGELDKYM